jgi:glycosyltransferase involved in cell wall biosynthesis
VLLEGMAAGLPVVATAVGGIGGVLKDGEMGYLVPAEDSESLALGCLKLIGDHDQRRKMGSNAYNHIRLNYGIGVMVDSISELYQTLLKKASE